MKQRMVWRANCKAFSLVSRSLTALARKLVVNLLRKSSQICKWRVDSLLTSIFTTRRSIINQVHMTIRMTPFSPNIATPASQAATWKPSTMMKNIPLFTTVRSVLWRLVRIRHSKSLKMVIKRVEQLLFQISKSFQLR